MREENLVTLTIGNQTLAISGDFDLFMRNNETTLKSKPAPIVETKTEEPKDEVTVSREFTLPDGIVRDRRASVKRPAGWMGLYNRVKSGKMSKTEMAKEIGWPLSTICKFLKRIENGETIWDEYGQPVNSFNKPRTITRGKAKHKGRLPKWKKPEHWEDVCARVKRKEITMTQASKLFDINITTFSKYYHGYKKFK